MPKFRVEFDCENAAFGETDADRLAEAGRLLSNLAEKLTDWSQGYPQGNIRDANGNTVGHWTFSQ